MMVFGQKGKSGVLAALGLGQVGFLFGGTLVALLFFVIMGSIVLFAEDDDAAATEMPSSGQSSIVTEALNIAYYLKMAGDQLDAFNTSATGPLPFPTKKYSSNYFTELYSYLAANHIRGKPANDVQCVAFVRAAYHMAGAPLPTNHGDLGDAHQYWDQSTPANGWSGWEHIANGEKLPSPGDIIVLNQPGQPGHVSIVISVDPPKSGQSTGTIMVAQGNAGYTTLTTQNDPRIQGLSVPAGIPLSELPYDPASNFVDSTWSSYSILGFLHNTKLENQAGQQGTVDGAGKTIKMFVSSYGYNDNSPPSAQIAYPRSSTHSTLHTQATEGSGTYNDPITFATSAKEFKPGTRVYVTFLQKYFIMEDICGACESAWSNGKYRIDLWMGPHNASDTHALSTCEGYITRSSTPVIVNPSSQLTVDTTPLFTGNKCTARIH